MLVNTWFSVLYNEVTIHFFNSIITISCMWKFSLIDTFQHWLPYDTFSSNNSSNNNYVSVVQICFSDLTACRTLILYQCVLTAAANDANSVLLIDAQQLRIFVHFLKSLSSLLSLIMMFFLYRDRFWDNRFCLISHCT